MVTRRSFVGRTGELRRLHGWLDESLQGAQRAVIVEGPAGIGKSALVDQVLADARRRGARVISATCHDGLSIPYLPIATMLRPLLHDRELLAGLDPAERDTLRAWMTPSATVAPTKGDEAEAQRLALFLSVSRAVVQAALLRPTVVWLDDLQFADPATCGLLGHLVVSTAHEGSTRPLPLFLTFTCRPPTAGSPTTSLLERITREPTARPLTLGGLDELEVNQLVVAVTGARLPRHEVLAIVEATAGNPQAVRAHLAAPSTADHGGSRAREADGQAGRVDRLGPDEQTVVTWAAVLGDGTTLDELHAVSGLDRSTFADALDRAEQAGLLRDDGTSCRFVDPGERRSIVARTGGLRQQAHHHLAADRLEAHYGPDADQHALTLLHHLTRAGPGVAPERVVHYAVVGGDRAMAIGAWQDASRAYDAALAALPDVAHPGVDHLDLAYRAAWAHFHDFDLDRADELFRWVVERARANQDLERWGDGVLGLTRMMLTDGVDAVGRAIDTGLAEEFLTAAGDELPHTSARLLALLAEAHFAEFDFAAGFARCDRSRLLAERADDPSLLLAIDFAEGLQLLGLLDLTAAEECFTAVGERAAALGDERYELWARTRLALVRWLRGDLVEAAADADHAARVAERAHSWAERSLGAAVQTGLAVAGARLSEVEHDASAALLMYHRASYPFTPGIALPQLACARATRGDENGAVEALDDWSLVGGPRSRRFRLLVLAALERTSELQEALDQRAWRLAPTGDPSLFDVVAVAGQVEVADAAARPDLIDPVVAPLTTLVTRGVHFCPEWCLFTPRLLGVAHLHSGDLEAAERAFTHAEGVARRAGAAGELARLELDLARLASARGDQTAAARRLARAASEFDRLGMLPLLTRTRHLEADLGLRPSPAPTHGRPPSVRVLMVTDLVESTQLNVRLGDHHYVELLREHNGVVRRRLREFDGIEFKHTGDGIFSWFSSASAAVRCALTISEDLDRLNDDHPDTRLSVRCGLAAGEPLAEGDDLFGLAVVRATRVCGAARSGQILLSEEVATLTAPGEVDLTAIGAIALKGLPAPIPLYEAGARVVQ